MSRAMALDGNMTAAQLVARLRELAPGAANLHLDSRAVTHGDVFLACPGLVGDGRHYIESAIAAGAGAVLMHVDHGDPLPDGQWAAVPVLAVTGLRARLGALAHEWYGHPSNALRVIAITGTNGKTSCAQWIAQALRGAGSPAGVIGTLGLSLPDGRPETGNLTTPDVVSVHRTLARMRNLGAGFVIMEASSIGLDQGRLDGVAVAVAAFTNLTRDHIDYHGDMQAYEAAKSRLFAWPGLAHAVINADDPAGRRFAADCRAPVVRFGLACLQEPENVVARDVQAVREGVCFDLCVAQDVVRVESRMPGLHNVSNFLCVAGVLATQGWGAEQIAAALSALAPVDGRLERVDSPVTDKPVAQVVVDYAHTPDALERALQALRAQAEARAGRLWCVFGCGGNRDQGKRPIMGEIACRLADQVVVTSDNPRDETPDAIIAQIVAGLPGDAAHVLIEPDRAQGILYAVMSAEPRDIVLLAGKGHETYQEVAGRRHAFDDRQWARAAMILLQGRALQSDSRRLVPGAVFLALRGDTFDGHDYLAQVAAAGACAAIVEQPVADASIPQIALGDTRAALLQLGLAWRRRFAIPLIAVTGSNGKTTTKDMIAAILAAWQGEDARLATAGNLNNELGVPLTLLRLTAAHKVAVIEMGMNHPGEIAVLTQAARPTVALVNNAQREHQEFMATVEAVARENAQVWQALCADGVAVYPSDDEFTALWDELSAGHAHRRFGEAGPGADVWATDIASDALGSSFSIHTPVGTRRITLPVPGSHNVRNALAAAACTICAGAPIASVEAGLAGFHAAAGRMQAHRLPGGVVLIDDTYNANPDSVRAAIDVLAKLPAPRVLVLGDMGEVGDNGPAMHREVGAYARERGIDRLLTLGDATRASAQAFGPGSSAFDSVDQVCEMLRAIAPSSMVVKGSRFMRMERIVRAYLDLNGVIPGEVVSHAV